MELPLFATSEADRLRRLANAVDVGDRGPYLERLSPGEVALMTSGRAAWRAQVVAQSRTSTTVRWVPIMSAEARPNIRVLTLPNAKGWRP